MKRDKTKIVCIAQFVAKEGKDEDLLNSLYSLINPTKTEPGCLRYELNQSTDDPRLITFVEKFKDKKAFDEHCSQPYITDYFRNKAPQLVESSSISMYQEII